MGNQRNPLNAVLTEVFEIEIRALAGIKDHYRAHVLVDGVCLPIWGREVIQSEWVGNSR